MAKYKIVKDIGNDTQAILYIDGNMAIPRDGGNRDYINFLKEVAVQGIDIVEGVDIVDPDYETLRTGIDGYLPIGEQLDILTKDGLEALQAVNIAVKEKFPKTITGSTSIDALPDWLQKDIEEQKNSATS
jgi:hypothetical protein